MELRSIGRSRNAVQVIDACIADINDGLWTCNALVVEDATEGKKPMGCALGLVGINSGQAVVNLQKDEETGAWECYASLSYPDEAASYGTPWNAAARKVVTALAETTKLTKNAKARIAKMNPENVLDQGAIITYNDHGRYGYGDPKDKALTKRSALAWFERAREALVNG